MKLAIVVPSFAGGGAERVAVNLSNHYCAQGIDVTLVLFSSDGPYKGQLGARVRVIDLDARRMRYVIGSLRRVLRSEAFTHVLSTKRDANMLLGISALFGVSSRLIFREANTMDGVQNMPPLKRWCYLSLMKLCYRRADRIIANSEDTRSDLLDFGIAERDRVEVIANPVVQEQASPDSLCSRRVHRWLGHPDFRVVLSIGRLHPQKNQKLLLESFSDIAGDHPELRLLLVGEGQEKTRLEQLIRSLRIEDRVEILDFQTDILEYYKRSTLFVLTSDWEGFGNVLVEALASGLPVISTDCRGGPRTILKGGELGVLVPCGDRRALAQAMNAVLLEPEMFDRNQLIARGQEFSVSRAASRYLQSMLYGSRL